MFKKNIAFISCNNSLKTSLLLQNKNKENIILAIKEKKENILDEKINDKKGGHLLFVQSKKEIRKNQTINKMETVIEKWKRKAYVNKETNELDNIKY